LAGLVPPDEPLPDEDEPEEDEPDDDEPEDPDEPDEPAAAGAGVLAGVDDESDLLSEPVAAGFSALTFPARESLR
jgi:hypothetical protein